MSDTTNWQCPDCGTIVSGPSHACSGHRVEIIDPRDARLALAHEIALAALEYRELATAPYPQGDIAQLQADAALDATVEHLDALLAKYFGDRT